MAYFNTNGKFYYTTSTSIRSTTSQANPFFYYTSQYISGTTKMWNTKSNPKKIENIAEEEIMHLFKDSDK